MRTTVLSWVGFVLIAVAGITSSRANEFDDKVAELHRENPNFGFLFFDVTLLKEGKPKNCTRLNAALKSAAGERARLNIHFITGPLAYSSLGTTYGGLINLLPGKWTVVDIICDDREDFVGRFGEIDIRPGEIIDAGNLVLDYTGSTGRTHAEAMRPYAVESVRTRNPLTYPKAVKRYFRTNLPPT